jgi:putative flippase GtrA
MKNNLKEWLKYGCNGVLTTAINYSIFFITSTYHMHYIVGNSIAWLIAVIFAYYTNRKWVFQSDGNYKEEFISFFSLRLITLVIENALLLLCIQYLMISPLLSKIVVSILIVIINYSICKTKIFQKGGLLHGTH